MKRPLADYGFWTGCVAKRTQWTTYAMLAEDEDGEPVGDAGDGATPEASLAACAAAIVDYDDRKCAHGWYRQEDCLWCAREEEDEG